MADARVVFDTNILWHGLVPSSDDIAPVCRRLLRAVDDGELRGYSSTLSLVELPKVITPSLPIERLVALTDTLHRSRLVWVPLTEPIAMRARDLSLQRGVAPPYDAVILATAIEIQATALYTFDRDDFPVGQTIDGVVVTTPALPPQLAQDSLPLDDNVSGRERPDQ